MKRDKLLRALQAAGVPTSLLESIGSLAAVADKILAGPLDLLIVREGSDRLTAQVLHRWAEDATRDGRRVKAWRWVDMRDLALRCRSNPRSEIKLLEKIAGVPVLALVAFDPQSALCRERTDWVLDSRADARLPTIVACHGGFAHISNHAVVLAAKLAGFVHVSASQVLATSASRPRGRRR